MVFRIKCLFTHEMWGLKKCSNAWNFKQDNHPIIGKFNCRLQTGMYADVRKFLIIFICDNLRNLRLNVLTKDNPASLFKLCRAFRCASRSEWRRGESNPRPNKSHTSLYARVLLLILAVPTANRQAIVTASIHINIARKVGCSPHEQTCCRRLIPLADIKGKTSQH
jgi:hypothetical protein